MPPPPPAPGGLALSTLDLAVANLPSPMVLFFALGLAAALARSDLSVPEAVAKGMALYLMMAIGFKGGVEVARTGLDARLAAALGAGVLLSAFTPLVAFALLRAFARLNPVDAAAVAAHHGSISIVTFAAGTAALAAAGMPAEGFMAAVAAAMETPAIVTALLLARLAGRAPAAGEGPREPIGALLREIGLNGSVVVLVGAFAIGVATGEKGLADVAPLLVAPYKGVLCLFLLDMGLVAGRGLRAGRGVLSPELVGFGLAMPLIGAALAAPLGLAAGLSVGGLALFMTLGASASYIAVPAAMRLALPEANPARALTISLGVTFPFNLALGIPLYAAAARRLLGV